jgi:hypothetical protein
MSNNRPTHRVYAVTKTGERNFWNAIGAAWVHSDGWGFNVKLDYRFENGTLIRLGRDGFLPDRISQWLRYENLGNAVPLPAGGYAYHARQDQATTIATLLPGAIDAGVTVRAPWDVIASARRNGSAERLVFTDGRFVSGRMPFNSTQRSSV